MVADERGRILGFGSGGAGNHESVGYAGLRQVLVSITEKALDAAGLTVDDISGAGFGVAGYDWPSEYDETADAVSVLQLSCPVGIVNDTVIGLLAGASRGWGLAIVAGTGENCWGRDREGRIGRVTGNGSIMGEYGGAGTIVTRAVHAVAKAWSLRGPDTRLIEGLLEMTGAPDLDRLLEGLALEEYQLDADGARMVVQTAELGDQVAREILEWSGSELADLAAGVIRQLDLYKTALEVVLVGSMFQGSTLIKKTFTERVLSVAPHASFVQLEVPPVVGGVLLGMEAAGLDAWRIRPDLIAHARGTKG